MKFLEQQSCKMYRQIVLVAAVLVAVVSAFKYEMTEDDKKIMDECAKELGYEMPKLQPGVQVSNQEWERFNCTMKCTGIKGGYISEDGVLNADKIKEKMPDMDGAEVDKAVEDCKSQTGDNECSKISAKMMCVMRKFHVKKGAE